MRKPLLLLCLLGSLGLAAQNLNITQRALMDFPGQTLANVWGYTAEGREYALLGGSLGVIVVDITNPDSPQQIVQIPGPNSLWKEIKTFGHYAYVVSEGGMGVQIIDLSPLPSPNLPYHSYYGDGLINGQLTKAHALHIDTTKGYLYVYGSNLNSGTPLIINLNIDPYNPTYAGRFNMIGYVHDGYVDNDTLYACHIYQGQFSIVELHDKLNPVLLATQNTPNNFPHNTWLSTDRRTLFTTDEVNNSFLAAYDITDPTDIKFLDKIQSNPGSNSIVHNTEIIGNYAVTSWYRDGFTIVDVTRPDNLVQVGNFDTYNGVGGGFQGCWGVYPYFPSGTIIASNISAPGSNNNGQLYILTPSYQRACYLEGSVSDASNSAPIDNALISIQGFTPTWQENTNTLGVFKTGSAQEGLVQVTISKPGYQSYQTEVLMEKGAVCLLNVELFPEGSLNLSGLVKRYNEPWVLVPNADVYLQNQGHLFHTISEQNGAFQFSGIPPGEYDLYATGIGYGTVMQYNQRFLVDMDSLQLELVKGYRRGDKLSDIEMVQVAPNPFVTETQVHCTATGPVRIQLLDANGNTLLSRFLKTSGESLQIGAQLQPGQYFLHISDAQGNRESMPLLKLAP